MTNVCCLYLLKPIFIVYFMTQTALRDCFILENAFCTHFPLMSVAPVLKLSETGELIKWLPITHNEIRCWS